MKTRRGHSGVEPTGEAKERETPAHLVTYEKGRVEEKTILMWNEAKGTAQNRLTAVGGVL